MTKHDFLRTLAILADIYGGESTVESVYESERATKSAPITVTATVRKIDRRTCRLDSVSVGSVMKQVRSIVEAIVIAESAAEKSWSDIRDEFGLSVEEDRELGKNYLVEFDVRGACVNGAYTLSTSLF